MIPKALKANFEKDCATHGLRTKYDVLPGCARILKLKGLFILEITKVSDCKYVPGSTGYLYPIGCTGLNEAAMNNFLAEAHDPEICFKAKNGEIVGKY